MNQKNILLKMELPLIPAKMEYDNIQNPLNNSEGEYFGTIQVNNHEWTVFYDKISDLWWVNPRPQADFYEILYGKLFYSSPLPEQFGYASLETDNMRRAEKAIKNWDDIEKNINLKSKNRILEIGCGTGEFLLEAKNRKWNFLMGNELEKSAAEIASHKGFKMHTGFFEAMSAKDEANFDLIFADNVIEHTMNPLVFLQKAFELMANQGLLVLRLPDTQSFGPTLKLIDHTFHFSRKSIAMFVEKAGFKVETIFYSGTFKGTHFEQDNTQRIENMTLIGRKLG